MERLRASTMADDRDVSGSASFDGFEGASTSNVQVNRSSVLDEGAMTSNVPVVSIS